MDRYTARWLPIPLEQYAALPPDAQRQVDQRVQERLEHPQGRSARTTCPDSVGGGVLPGLQRVNVNVDVRDGVVRYAARY